MSRHEAPLHLQRTSCAELVDLTRSKISTQIDQAGWQLVEQHATPNVTLLVDRDAFTQVLINLVDNSIKFGTSADPAQLDFASEQIGNRVVFTLRDYGPGIPKNQLKKIFALFYRVERELTRETVGTGIGLALVQQLVAAMHGSIDVRNTQPGVEFRIELPTADD